MFNGFTAMCVCVLCCRPWWHSTDRSESKKCVDNGKRQTGWCYVLDSGDSERPQRTDAYLEAEDPIWKAAFRVEIDIAGCPATPAACQYPTIIYGCFTVQLHPRKVLIYERPKWEFANRERWRVPRRAGGLKWISESFMIDIQRTTINEI